MNRTTEYIVTNHIVELWLASCAALGGATLLLTDPSPVESVIGAFVFSAGATSIPIIFYLARRENRPMLFH